MEIYEGEFKGFEEVSGQKKDGSGTWTKLTCLVKDTKDEYAQGSVPFTTFFSKNIDAVKNIPIGSVVRVTYKLRGRQWENDGVVKHFLDAAMEMIDVLDTPMDIMPPQAAPKANPLQVVADEDDMLPF